MPNRILIVDDDNAARRSLAGLLSDARYEVLVARTVPAAMRVLARRAPQLLITEIRLAGYNGLQIVALNPTPIPAIVLTGFPDRVLEIEARKLGADYLEKPVSPPALLALIQQKLAAAAEAAAYSPVRRWARKRVTTHLPARIDDAAAQIVDISYGGLRLEIDRAPGAWLPPSFSLHLPGSGVAVDADLVWKKETGDARWLCGVAVLHDAQPVWREVVDSL